MNNMELEEAIKVLRNAELNTDYGMPEDLFLAISGLMPIVNVDLLITNDKGQLLLARRDDEFYGQAWHIPGRCIRYKETILECVENAIKNEVGDGIVFEKSPISVVDLVNTPGEKQLHKRERGHNVSLLFKCTAKNTFIIDNHGLHEDETGFLKWFDKLPEDFLKQQYIYKDILNPWC